MVYSSGVDWPTAMRKLTQHMAALPRGKKKAVAEKLGLSPSQWSQYISGERGITPEKAHRIAQELGIELNIQLKSPDGEIDD